jgi:arylsulfatase A-like enzyme
MITASGGYADGFDRFENPMRDGEGARRNGWIPGARIVRRGLDLIADDPARPWFLFLGTIDTHKPWVGHQPWLSRYDPGHYRGPFRRRVRPRDIGIAPGSMRCTERPRARDLARINAIYDSDVSYQDAQLVAVLDRLEAWGIARQTLIVVTSDHGEELWEDGRCGHGGSLRETLVRVPLVIAYPPLFPEGAVVDEGVDGVDVLPTIADALGLVPLDQFQGASLRPLAHGIGRGYPRASYASQYEYAHAMRIGSWKLRLGRAVELHDLASDPDERRSVHRDHPIAHRFVGDPMALFLEHRAVWNKRTWGSPNNMTPDAARAMRDLALRSP